MATLDQELSRNGSDLGLVSFVGDGARLARSIRGRCYFGLPGRRKDECPVLLPGGTLSVELELPASNGTVTGLGIERRRRSRLQVRTPRGKTTFLEGIIAGMDDHAVEDGREMVVTDTASAARRWAMLAGADVSMFFSALPPGMNGAVHSASGMGNGSMNMAYQV